MELEDVCSDLLALIKLYRLLQISEDNLINPNHVILDDNTKLFLKRLLDGALEKVFGTHSKIRAAQSFMPNEPCCTPLIQPDTNMRPQDISEDSATVNTNSLEDSNPRTVLLSKDEKLLEKQIPEAPVLEDISKASPGINTFSLKDSNSDTVTLPIYKELMNKQMPKHKVSDLSVAHIPASKPTNTKKRCRSCQQRSLKQQNLIGAIKRANGKILISNTNTHQDPRHTPDQSLVGKDDESVSNSQALDSVENKCAPVSELLLHSSSTSPETSAVKPSNEHNLVIEIDKKLEVVDHLSEEITEAIKQIKSRLQDLTPTSKDIEPLVEDSVKSTVQIPTQCDEGIIRGNELSPVNDIQNHGQEPVLAASNGLQIQEMGQRPLRNTRDQPSQLGGKRDGNIMTSTSPDTVLKPVLKSTELEPTLNCGLGQADISDTGRTNTVKAMIEKIESMNRLKNHNEHLAGQARKCIRILRSAEGQGSTLSNEMPNLVKNPKIEPYLAPQNDTSADMQVMAPPLQPQSLDSIDPVSSNKKVEEVREQLIMNLTLTGCNASKIDVHPCLYNDHVSCDDQKRNENMHAAVSPPLLPHSEDPGDHVQESRKVEEAGCQSGIDSALLDCDSSKILVHPTTYDDHTSEDHKRTGSRKRFRFRPQRKIIASQQISEETNSSSGSSSSWRSEETSTSYGESVSRSESYGSSEYSSSLSPSRRSTRTEFRPSRRSNYTSKRSSRLIIPKKEFRPPEHQLNLVKQTGRLRKLKDKLGLIFHHHHHHHHHNQNNNDYADDEDDSDHAEAPRAISLWTNTRKVFHSTNQKKTHNDDHPQQQTTVSSRKKALVRTATTKNQHGHFHSLVEGLLKHIRHSKNSQPHRAGVKPLGSNRHGRDKKAVKKLHWWQTLKRKRGAKLPYKGRVKLGYGGKRTQLKST